MATQAEVVGLAVGITGMAELECERSVIGEQQGAAAVGIKPPDRVESGLLCQFPGQQVQNGCAAFGVMAAAQHPGGLVEQNGEAASRIGQRLVVDFDAIEAGIGPIA